MIRLAVVMSLLAALLLTLARFSVGGAPGVVISHAPGTDRDATRMARERLGKLLFVDPLLSEPAGTSCSSCHDPAHAFSGLHGSTSGVPLGALPGSYGLRNTPTLTYESEVPPFTFDKEDDPLEPKGGQFLDGRASFLDEQAEGPLLSPREMNNRTRALVVAKITAHHAADFRAAFGADVFDHGERYAFLAVGAALQAYESTPTFHPFSSHFDRYRRGTYRLSDAESRGMTLFFASDKGNCSTCHQARISFAKVVPLFTDFGYETLGVPRNQRIPDNADPDFFDLGLGGPKRTLPNDDQSFNGAFMTPILRNVAVKQAFMHNGIFTHLEEVVAFYATRDTNPWRWYPHNHPFNDTRPIDLPYVNTGAPFGGKPGAQPHLTAQEILDLVTFLRSLTDQEFEAALPPLPTLRQIDELLAPAQGPITAPPASPTILDRRPPLLSGR